MWHNTVMDHLSSEGKRRTQITEDDTHENLQQVQERQRVSMATARPLISEKELNESIRTPAKGKERGKRKYGDIAASGRHGRNWGRSTSSVPPTTRGWRARSHI
ncbi:hypothetical protein V501_10252 [Pseudogymnoascus sp. VKM F-4519 (FW-2642)]|nr:hypothetical protein V501_10252 [Pseudogymnoascus sp. VKM F-4519 (FW-2642)]